MLELDKIYTGDCREVMKQIDDNSIDLIVTSPPYNCGKEYENELTDVGYYEFILPIIVELKRILKLDGRFAINIVFNINRIEEDKKIVLFPYIQWINTLLKTGLVIKEDIIWDQLTSGCETAWGSWKSPSAPHIRHMTERVIVGYNEQWGKINRGESDLTEREFMLYTLDKWRFNSEHDRIHPAAFPEELPKRCIKLFSFVGDVILDPFVGSGTTCVVAKNLRRKYIGIELNPEYVKIANSRLSQKNLFDRIDELPQKKL